MSRAQGTVTYLPDAGKHLTVRVGFRQSDHMPEELLLHGRVHVDLVRTASARCPVR